MTVLTALATLYDRMEQAGEVPRPGYSNEKIGYRIVLNPDGSVARFDNLMVPNAKGNKMVPKVLAVPSAVKRSSGIAPNMLWDKTAYVLGVTAIEAADGTILAGQAKRTLQEHDAFKEMHAELLAGTNDPGLVALKRFLETWQPDMFQERGYRAEALDQNIVFRLKDGASSGYIHDRHAAIDLIQAQAGGGDEAFCLISGERAPVSRLHPLIKNVDGAQSSGASIVSFNDDAYESFGKVQGANAPVSEGRAAAYGVALNALLMKGSTRNVRIGDTATVFWAEAPDQAVARAIEGFMTGDLIGGDEKKTDSGIVRKERTSAEVNAENELRDSADLKAEGKARDDPEFKDVNVYILGLAPNAARLVVRFWYPGTFGDFNEKVRRFWNDLEIEPRPWSGPPKAQALLYETAVQRKKENIPKRLDGELMRAVLFGTNYPMTLFSAVIGRIRAEGKVSGPRAAICKACVNRNFRKEIIPVHLSEETIPDSPNKDDKPDRSTYLLGRLFAAYAYAEHSYIQRNVTIRDKYMAGASASPRRVFPVVMRGYENNRAGLKKSGGAKAAYGRKADAAISRILQQLPEDYEFPATLPMLEQAQFFVGFYHQWNSFFERPEDAAEAAGTTSEEDVE